MFKKNTLQSYNKNKYNYKALKSCSINVLHVEGATIKLYKINKIFKNYRDKKIYANLKSNKRYLDLVCNLFNMVATK